MSSAARPRVGVAIPAAGEGRRMGGRRKPWLELLGEPVLLHTLRPFLAHPSVVSIRVALSPEDAAAAPAWLTDLDPRVGIVAGGATRAASVKCALDALPPDVDVVLVHDAARPLVGLDVLDRCIDAAARGEAVVAGWPASDTLKQVDDDRHVVATPDRTRLWHAQTPQAFPIQMLRDAYGRWDGRDATDDATLVERAGGRVRMVEGSATNLKVTRPEDVAVAEALLAIAAPARAGEPSTRR
jgi:2-C-methyl-D-erythritol 4-phosphate cytidylyltransferase